MKAESFTYGRGDGSHPCTCSCFDGACSKSTTPDPSDDFFNSRKLISDDSKKSKGKLTAKISEINGIGIMSVTFSH
jgi:hypothetical protein